jgi:hypothetical protein
MHHDSFMEKSWQTFSFDPALKKWVDCALPIARSAVNDESNRKWLRCGGTWFVGVNALPNNSDGSVKSTIDGDQASLQGEAVQFTKALSGMGHLSWDQAQISVFYRGHPQPSSEETDSAFQYRKSRDAAHVDGLLPEGPRRRRFLRELHGFILGIPMVKFSCDASPFVVWEGSHHLVKAAFQHHFGKLPVDKWQDEDLTDVYQQTRRQVFESCRRKELYAQPGEAFVVHRLAVHGVGPWAKSATASSDGRIICYFRPYLNHASDWLNLD